MGVATAELTVASNPSDFVREMKQALFDSYVSGDLTKMRFLQDADDENRIFIDLQWKDLATARKNFESLNNMLSTTSVKADFVRELQIKSHIGPDIEIV
ncbi:hypothetical protein [Nostoc sp. FACHB-190]|uniref:hypothetical protein n=1 Tax=Nostoc sp. FACHB-190 TaxID=2692838 RepID=UPI0016885A2C|nr:hypothetical protein [Nostoc sp. FACHB-190]MBD2303671.1 hypothetical protein [Nostoc sp. FACHB-190]